MKKILNTKGHSGSLMIKNICMLFFVLHDTHTFAKSCYQSEKTPNKQFIYLHGLDSNIPSDQERHNRTVLEKIANEQQVRIFIARSMDQCKNKLCWPHYNKSLLEQTWQKIKSQSKGCIDQTKPVGLLGFSNGGYFATKALQHCIDPMITEAIVVGSSGSASKQLCGKLKIVIGTKDLTYRKANQFFINMAKHKAQISFDSFQGGHELKDTPKLINAILNIEN